MFLFAAAAAGLLSPARAEAHNGAVHQHLVELSFDVMAAATAQSVVKDGVCLDAFSTDDFLLAPPAQDAATVQEWRQFLSDVSLATCALRASQSDLPAAFEGEEQRCIDAHKTPITIPDSWNGPTLGDVRESVHTGYAYPRNKDACNLDIDADTEHGLFHSTSGGSSKGAFAERTGNILGFWSASVDNHDADLATEIAFKNEFFVDLVNNVVGTTAGAIWHSLGGLASVLDCIYDWMGGGHCSEDLSGWWEQVQDTSKDVQKVLRGAESLVTVRQGPNHDFLGVWHHIMVGQRDLSAYDPDGIITADIRYGKYDDRRGFFMDLAGPTGVPDAFEIAVMVGADLLGYSVDPTQSAGVENYQIAAGNDGHPDTIMRASADFELETLPHTEFEPVDNLAKYGWDQFTSSGGIHSQYLGWPLHALGDATVPQHTVGSVGWGHRPFEDAMENLWTTLTYQRYGNPGDTEKTQQVAQAHRVLVSAFHWNRWLKQTQQARGISDLPVRDLVTELAQRTHDTSIALWNQNNYEWPFSPLASLGYAAGMSDVLATTVPGLAESKEDAIDQYSSFVSPGGQTAAEMYRPILESGMGATVAFLVATGRDHSGASATCSAIPPTSIKSSSGCGP